MSPDDPTDASPPAPRSQRRGWQRWLLDALLVCWLAIGVYLALLPDPPGSVFGGKYGHALVAGVLAFGVVIRFPRSMRGGGVLLVGGAVLAGVVVEVLQATSAVRRGVEVIDVVGGVIGVASGAALAVQVRKVRRDWSVTAATVGVGACAAFALFGPVGESAPVRRWLECRSDRTDPATAERRLARRSDGTAFESPAGPVTTEFGPGRSTDHTAEPLVHEIRCRETFTVTARVRPDHVDQFGPRRIVSIARGTDAVSQQLMVGISRQDLVVRIRFRAEVFEEYTIPDVFEAGAERSIAVRYDRGRLAVTVDGATRFLQEPERATLANWTRRFPVNVGNELTDDRRFDGQITDVRLTATA